MYRYLERDPTVTKARASNTQMPIEVSTEDAQRVYASETHGVERGMPHLDRLRVAAGYSLDRKDTQPTYAIPALPKRQAPVNSLCSAGRSITPLP